MGYYNPDCVEYVLKLMNSNNFVEVVLSNYYEMLHNRHECIFWKYVECFKLLIWLCSYMHAWIAKWHIYGLMRDCNISSALAMELLHSCTKSSIWDTHNNHFEYVFKTKETSYRSRFSFSLVVKKIHVDKCFIKPSWQRTPSTYGTIVLPACMCYQKCKI